MDLQSLTAIGLSSLQAQAYALLIEHGELKPPSAARQLGLTRTNAYKVLDKLVELRLARKIEIKKKLVYSPTNPMALADLTSQYRAKAKSREEAVNSVMQTLLQKYYKHAETAEAKTAVGQQAVAEMYRKQIALGEELYFVHTKADVPAMGFETMHDIRIMPAQSGNKRNGILSADAQNTVNPDSHKESKLDVTWLESGKYTAPLEWSATESSLLIVIYAAEPQAIFITNPLVGGAFIQIWQLLSPLIRVQPTHQTLSKGV